MERLQRELHYGLTIQFQFLGIVWRRRGITESGFLSFLLLALELAYFRKRHQKITRTCMPEIRCLSLFIDP
jgi:hypothetical protein